MSLRNDVRSRPRLLSRHETASQNPVPTSRRWHEPGRLRWATWDLEVTRPQDKIHLRGVALHLPAESRLA